MSAAIAHAWGGDARPTTAAEMPRPGYINHMPPERPEAREARHRKIAERRAQPYIIMVHRGAHKFAPENTLEAYNAAMNYGADGCEIDIHRTKDGVLVMHHDDQLGRTVGGSGAIKELTYYQILEFELHGGGPQMRMPTLAATLELARRRCMLLHLDIKQPGLEDDLIRMFNEADMWDHIVSVNAYNSEKIRADRRLHTFSYKGWLEEAGDGDRLQAFRAKPEKMIITKYDPTRAVNVIGRKVKGQDMPVPEELRVEWLPGGPLAHSGGGAKAFPADRARSVEPAEHAKHSERGFLGPAAAALWLHFAKACSSAGRPPKSIREMRWPSAPNRTMVTSA